jgi:segregation and condensation protein B
MAEENDPANNSNESPLSLSRLRQAFAAMLGEREATQRVPGTEQGAGSTEYGVQSTEQAEELGRRRAPYGSLTATCEINPRSVVEALLFVGRPDNGPFSARELAAAMRGVSPTEIDAAVRELNSLYERDVAPYQIEATGAGYRLVLRDEFKRMRDKFYGTIREAKLSPAALEVLSIIAYNQPIDAERINELRSATNGAALATLVRRRLVRQDRPDDAGAKPSYSTTERFLKLFGLESLDTLPRSEELEKV